MSSADGPSRSGLIARVEAILLRPLPEWDIIAGEEANVAGLFTGYACILAAVGPIAMLARRLTFFGLFFHWSVGAVVGAIALDYALSLVGVYILGLIIDAAAPSYGAERNPVQAMKLAVYAATPMWLAGAFSLVPLLGRLWVLGFIYALYLYWLGLPKLMKPAADKTTNYYVVTVAAAVVIGAIFARLVEMIALASIAGAMFHLPFFA